MGLFSKTVDYNLILERVLEGKRFSANVKSLLLSMLYKIEISYTDYIKVKQIKKTKDEILLEIIEIIREYIDIIKTVEPESEEAEVLKKYNVLALTNEKERSILSYPTESAMLYAISDIQPKYFYMEDFILKKELQQILVDGNNLNNLEIIEDFNGWSWNSKNIANRGYIENLVYQNLIMMYGIEFIDKCKISSSKNFCITERIKKSSIEYYEKLIELVYLKFNDNNIKKRLENKIDELEKVIAMSENKDLLNKKKAVLLNKIEKIGNILKDESRLKKSYQLKIAKLDNGKKDISLKKYIKTLEKEKNDYINKVNEIDLIYNQNQIEKNKKELNFHKNLLKTQKSINELIIELQQTFINILDKKSKQIKTREEFIDIIYKIRYYRNIFFSKNKAIKDCDVLEKQLKKILARIITFGSKNAYIKMVSLNVNLNAKILINILDSKIMELEDIKIRVEDLGKTLIIDVFENETFERRFQINYKIENPEITIRKKKNIKIFI